MAAMSARLPAPPYDLWQLYKHPAINQISSFCEVIDQLNIQELVCAYDRARKSAPRRQDAGKQYFVAHKGSPVSGARSNRREEHLAIALWRNRRDSHYEFGNDRTLRILDYQLPLKAKRRDKGVGKVDLFGVLDEDRASVIELKIHPQGSAKGDTPLRAFLEALAYCAVIESNLAEIAEEISHKFRVKLSPKSPALVLMASEEYWAGYLNYAKDGNWWSKLQQFVAQLSSTIDLESVFLALRDADFTMGLNGELPTLIGKCSLHTVGDPIVQRSVGQRLRDKRGLTPASKSSGLGRRAESRAVERLVALKGKSVLRSEPATYTSQPNQNLIPGVNTKDFWDDLLAGAGNELIDSPGNPAKFCAAFSSSALVVNSFGPFRHEPWNLNVCGIGGFEILQFEKVLPTGLAGTPPHLDVFASGPKYTLCIESKFLELLWPKEAKFTDSYEQAISRLAHDSWSSIYRSLKRNPLKFRFLDAAQLVKHYLGMRNTLGKASSDLVLLYVYWEPSNAADLEEYRVHQSEVAEFSDFVKGSDVSFVSKSYPQLWEDWKDGLAWTGIGQHVQNLVRRYHFEI